MPISTLYAQYGRIRLEDQFLYKEIWYSYFGQLLWCMDIEICGKSNPLEIHFNVKYFNVQITFIVLMI